MKLVLLNTEFRMWSSKAMFSDMLNLTILKSLLNMMQYNKLSGSRTDSFNY